MVAEYDINLREYWRILKKRKLIVFVITLCMGFFSTFFAILRTPTPLYKTVCLIEIQKAPVLEGLYPKTMSWSESDDIETQMTVIKSYAVFQKVAEKMGLIPREVSQGEGQLKSSHILVIENLQSKVEIKREKFSSILHIEVTDSSPAFAQELANSIALTYRELHAEEQVHRTKETLKYIDEQLKDLRGKVRDAEEEFNRFSKDNEIISIDLQSERLLTRAQEIQVELGKQEEERREVRDLLLRLNHFIENPASTDRDFYSAKANGRYQAVNETFVGLMLKRDTLLKEYTAKHPDVVAIGHEIAENASKMALTLQQQLRNIDKREIELAKEAETVERKTKVLLDKKLEYNRLKRKVELYTDMIVLLERKNQEAMIRRAEKPEKVNIVKPALLPGNPINPPQTALNGALGVLVGLILGLIAAFVVETFDTSLGAIEDVEKTLGTQVLGIIPETDAKGIHETLKERMGELAPHVQRQAVNLISHFLPQSMMSESFRAVRTNIDFKYAEKKLKTFLITSTAPQEGKTLIAANLALTMAQAGKKTLLIASDLRKPSVGRIFGLKGSPGLTDVLLGNYRWRDTVNTVADLLLGEMTFDEVMMTPRMDNLHFIPSGAIPFDPAELLQSEHLAEFLGEAKKEYDVLVFDAPPILSAADAIIIGKKVDGVLLVYRIGAVSRRLLRRACSQLEHVKSNVVGVIINGMRPEVSPDFEDYKQYRYYYSYGAEDRDKKGGENRKRWLPGIPVAALAKKGLEKARQSFLGEQRNGLKTILFMAAMALLGAGIFWQSGVSSTPTASYQPTTPSSSNPKTPMGQDRGAAEMNPSGKGSEIPPAPAPESREPAVGLGKKEDPLIVVAKEETQAGSHPEGGVTGVDAAQPAEASSARAGVEKPDPSYPVSICLASFPELKLARQKASEYRNRGVTPYIIKLDSNKGVWFGVYVGYFENGKEAKKLIRRMGFRGARVIETPWANLIGAYSSAVELEEKLRALADLVNSPYVIRGSDGKDRLYVGAFNAVERAKRQHEELKERGIDNEIVKR